MFLLKKKKLKIKEVYYKSVVMKFLFRWLLPPGGFQSKGPTGSTPRVQTPTSQTGRTHLTTHNILNLFVTKGC